MKILLFTLEYPPFKGGVANYYENLVKFWPEPDNIFVLNNNEKKLTKSWLYPKWLPAIFYLYKTIKLKKIDHIFIGHLLPLGTVTYIISKVLKIKYSIFIHGMDFAFSQKSTRKAKITEKILDKAVQIICTNNYVAELITKTYGEKYFDKIFIANPGVNSQMPFNDNEISQNVGDKIILFSIGRLVLRKGFDKVIEALPEVLKTVPSLVYVIAGTGPDETYLKKLANGHNEVIFKGKIDDEEKWTWLAYCDIFITVSRDINGDFEGFGIVYLEAGLAQKPVIAGNSGGIRDAVIDQETGLIVQNPEDIHQIAQAIIKLANDIELRKKLGENAKNRMINKFSWPNQIKKIYNVINKN